MGKAKQKLENLVAVLKEYHFWLNAVGISIGGAVSVPFGIKAYENFTNVPPNIALGIGLGAVSLAGAVAVAAGAIADAYLIKNIEGIKKRPWDYYLYR